jgi:hypothetical protein
MMVPILSLAAPRLRRRVDTEEYIISRHHRRRADELILCTRETDLSAEALDIYGRARAMVIYVYRCREKELAGSAI